MKKARYKYSIRVLSRADKTIVCESDYFTWAEMEDIYNSYRHSFSPLYYEFSFGRGIVGFDDE